MEFFFFFFDGLANELTWRLLHAHLKRMCVLLLSRVLYTGPALCFYKATTGA